jgi:catechol 2,3-dioxygenase-like lactoylglutathione lyase family enzyme
MNWTLEVITLPVADVDRAKDFYADRVGFDVDHDSEFSDELRVVQLTPPGSGCSIVIGKGLLDSPPGSVKGLQLVVPDVRAARTELLERGVDVSEVEVLGPEGRRPARDDDELDNAGFVFFSDPDGNGWAVQQISSRA